MAESVEMIAASVPPDRRFFQRIRDGDLPTSAQVGKIHERLQKWYMEAKYQPNEEEKRRIYKIHNTATTLGVGAGIGTHVAIRSFKPMGRTGTSLLLAERLNRFSMVLL